MKKYLYLLTSAFVCGITSCVDSYNNEFTAEKQTVKLTQNELKSILYDDHSEDLSNSEIIDMVQTFAKANYGGHVRNASSFEISEETYINKGGEFTEKAATRGIQSEVEAKICRVEFTNGDSKGCAIVSANRNLPSIIAFIPHYNNERTMEASGANDLLHASKASYLYELIKTKELADSLRVPTLSKISKDLNLPIEQISYETIENNVVITDAHSSTRSVAIQGEDITVQIMPSTILPYVETNWDQFSPYNDIFADAGYKDWIIDKEGRRQYGAVPAGCVNIALAQIMTYTHARLTYPLNFPNPTFPGTTFIPDFSRMADTPKLDDKGANSLGRTHAQWLILDLYKMNNTKSTKDYTGAVTASEVSEGDMIKTMQQYFSFSSKAPFDTDKALAALRNKQVILMLTSNHAFIISGLLVTEKTIKTRQLVENYDVYWHANFGWGDECTGFYKVDDNTNTYFEANGLKVWDYKLDCINNIRAKQQ